MHFCASPPAEWHDYSASGTHLPVVEADLDNWNLFIQGYEVDVIVETGKFCHGSLFSDVDWLFALQGWEHIAGGPWTDCHSGEAFDKTLIGDT